MYYALTREGNFARDQHKYIYPVSSRALDFHIQDTPDTVTTFHVLECCIDSPQCFTMSYVFINPQVASDVVIDKTG